MNCCRHEGVSQRVHLEQRSHTAGVTEIEGVDTASERRAGGGLNGDNAERLALQLLADEGEGEAGKVGATADAAEDDIRVIADLGKLLQCLQADDCLVEEDVVEHAAERVFGV